MKKKKGDFTMLGATAHAKGKREPDDFYATDPLALEMFLGQTGIILRNVWEPACGQGHLAEVLRKRGLLGKATDLVDRGYGEQEDFFCANGTWDGDILTNPPYGRAKDFCEHAIGRLGNGGKAVMLMRIQFLEGKGRKSFFQAFPPRYVCVSSSRLRLAKGGDFEKYSTPSANCYAWYVWEKGWGRETVVRWFN